MNRLLTILFSMLVLTASAQGIDKVQTLRDGTRVISTTLVKFAQSRPVFGKSQRVAMRHVAVSPTEQCFVVVLPMSADHMLTLSAGRRLVLRQANGEVMTLRSLRDVTKAANENMLDAIYTIYPEYIVSESQLAALAQSEVVSISQEKTTADDFVELNKSNYQMQWDFNRMLQRCYNVLRWRLAEGTE